MRLSKQQPPAIPAMSLTPMIDVVLLLIIFFMMVSQITELKRAKVELPKLVALHDQSASMLTVNVDAAGRIFVGGDPLSIEQLDALVSAELDRMGNDAPSYTVVLRADQHCASDHVNRVVQRLGSRGVQSLRVAAQDPN